MNERERVVKPDGHGEATRAQELYHNELASIDIQGLSPNPYPDRVGHRGLRTCR
jgi:hypothetical protein